MVYQALRAACVGRLCGRMAFSRRPARLRWYNAKPSYASKLAAEEPRNMDIETTPKTEGDTVVAPGIVTNPGRQGGRPTIAGTRITVEHVLYNLAVGESVEDILHSFPHLTREQVQAAIRYAADLVHALVPEISDEELDRLAGGKVREETFNEVSD